MMLSGAKLHALVMLLRTHSAWLSIYCTLLMLAIYFPPARPFRAVRPSVRLVRAEHVL